MKRRMRMKPQRQQHQLNTIVGTNERPNKKKKKRAKQLKHSQEAFSTPASKCMSMSMCVSVVVCCIACVRTFVLCMYKNVWQNVRIDVCAFAGERKVCCEWFTQFHKVVVMVWLIGSGVSTQFIFYYVLSIHLIHLDILEVCSVHNWMYLKILWHFLHFNAIAEHQ